MLTSAILLILYYLFNISKRNDFPIFFSGFLDNDEHEYQTFIEIEKVEMRKIEILAPEWEKIQEEVEKVEHAKQEISELGRIANEQGSETFGHDNPILENKKEQNELLHGRLLAKGDILSQIQNCLIVSEEDILSRKQNPEYMGLGSIVSVQMNGVRKELEVILTGLMQGKIEF